MLVRVHSRVAWLALFIVLFAILTPGLHEVRSIQLLYTVLLWFLGGAVAVSVVDALAGWRLGQDDDSRVLRLRSLRLVGGVVIAIGLALSLSSRQLGHGTIHSWVSKLAWLAVVPVFLI